LLEFAFLFSFFIFRQGAYIPEISIEGEARMDVEVSEICIALRIECYARSC